MENISSLGNHAFDMCFGFLHSLNSKTQRAKHTLETEGLKVLKTYNQGQVEKGFKIQDLVMQVLAPIQTLYLLSASCFVLFYSGRKILPWPLSPICTAGMLTSGFIFWDIASIKKEVQLTRFYFERRGQEDISKEELLTELDHLGDRMLSSSTILQLINQSKGESVFSIKEMVGQMIKTPSQEEVLSQIKKLPGIALLFSNLLLRDS